MSLRRALEERIEQGHLLSDPAQFAVAELLDDLLERAGEASRKFRRLGGLFGGSRNHTSHGLYIWGKVGRGKSMLMDLFYEHLDAERKRRVHFLEFMQSVHADLHEIRKRDVDDAVLPAADRIARNVTHLCLDEMQIDDIADAMIVGRFFERLFERNVTVVTTSNRPPEELYKYGLNRHLFVPFIELIRDRMTIHELGGAVDHRQGRLAGTQTYFFPANEAAQQEIDGIWNSLAGPGVCRSLSLPLQGRMVELPRFANGAARARFDELCARPYGPGDYLAIANAVRLLVIEDVPLMTRSNQDEAKRFVMLVDALYDSGVSVVISAAASPEQLHDGRSGSFEFERTASRLAEMQSADWRARSAQQADPTGGVGATSASESSVGK